MLSSRLWEPTWRKHNIKVVVNLGHEKPGVPTQHMAAKVAAEKGIERHIFAMSGDGTGNPENYVQALVDIVQALRLDKPVHVHCASGVYRTGAAIALYRLFVQNWSEEAVFQELIDHTVGPDEPLIPYLNSNMSFFARRLHEEGIISEVPTELPVLASGRS
jgi:protein tyrosine/serine phosphatase